MDGILCLADILTDGNSAEAARAEAAAVVAQITSPHHTSTQHLGSFLESMQDIVTALISECMAAVLQGFDILPKVLELNHYPFRETL